MRTLPAGFPADAFAAFDVLKSRKTLGVDDLKVLAMIECYGEMFYLNLAQAVGNDEARSLLTRNGQEERGHAHRLLKAMALLGDTTFTLPDAQENPFLQGPPQALAISADLLAALESGEVDGDLQYQTWADAEPNTEIGKLYRQNGSEETRHSERVAQVKRLLQA